MPAAPREYYTVPNVIRTPFIEGVQSRAECGPVNGDALRGQILDAVKQGRLHEIVPMAGQGAGLIHDIPSAAELIERIAAEAEVVLRSAGKFARD